MIQLSICIIVSAAMAVVQSQDRWIGVKPGNDGMYKFPGQARDISVKGSEFWAIHTNNSVLRYSNFKKTWQLVPTDVRNGYIKGDPASIAASPDGWTYMTTDKSYIYRWDYDNSHWDWQDWGKLKQINAIDRKSIIGVNEYREVWSYNHGELRNYPGKALFAAIGEDNERWMVDLNHKINRWDEDNGVWEAMPGFATSVDLVNKNRAVMTGDSGRVYLWNGKKWSEIGEHAHRASIDDNAVYWVTETDDIVMALDSVV